MSTLYRHTQPARILMWVYGVTFVVLLAVALVVNNTVGWIVLGAVAAVELGVGYLFSSLTVEVTEDTLPLTGDNRDPEAHGESHSAAIFSRKGASEK